MLVTKREVKKASKKLLSVLLAVVMMMSSMSVCFGTFTTASAANLGGDHSGYKATDAYTYLAEHLNGATVKKYTDKVNIGNTTNEGKAGSSNDVTYVTDIKTDTYEEYCELRDIIIYLDLAIKATSCYQTGTADKKDEATKSCVSAGDVEAEILDGLAGETTVSDAAKEFVAYVLEDSRATQHSAAGGSDKSPKNHTATLNVYTEDYKGYLDAHNKGDYATVDASIEMGYTYTMYMKGDVYYETTGTCKEKKYHNMIFADNLPAAPSSNKGDSSVKITLSDYASYVDNFIATNSYNKMALMSAGDIDVLKNTLASKTTTIKNYIADAGEGKQDEMFDKLFPGYKAKIDKFNSDAEDAKAIAAYSSLATAIADFQAANPNYGVFNWGGFDEATIKADYKTFTEAYASLLNNATVYNYFTETIGTFSNEYIVNFRDNVVAYDLDDLRIEKVQPLYDTYVNTWNTIEFAEQQTAYSSLSGYIKNIRSYTAQVQNAIFSDLDLFLDLEEKLECTVADCIVYFAENVNRDYSDASTEDVIKEIATANSQLAALNALSNSVDYADNKALLDVPFANAATFIDYLYSLLGARFTAQVDVADKAYTEIGRPTSNLTISQYSHLSAYINAIEPDIVTYLDGAGQGAKVTQATRTTYENLKNQLMPAFNAFEADRGYTSYTAENVIIRREDNADEIFRQNDDLDSDGVGEYEVTDANVEKIVELLDAALKDETVKDLLGDLINKDKVTGEPTGEDFSLGALVSGLLEESVYTDALINTIMQFVYPLVLKEFAKVWAGLPPTVTIPDVDTGFLGIKADVEAGLKLDNVETAIASVGLYIAPTTLAAHLNSVYGDKYDAVEAVLEKATTKANYDKENDTFRNPWENTNLFKDVIDETTGEPVIGDDGKVKRVYDLVWGVDTATNKRAAFLDAAVAALSGLEPLLMALISNKDFANPDVTDGDARGIKIGYGQGNASVGIDLSLSIDPITLTLTFSANDGWDNALAPIFEALGLTNIPHSEDLQTTRKLLEEGLLAMIDQLIAKLNDKPVEFLLNALPNLAYMLEAGMIEPLLHEIKTVINYYADAVYDAGVASGNMLNAMKSEEPININIGEMINLKDMGLDISNFKAIWNMIAGGVEMLAGVEAPDASFLASLGQLTAKTTNRSVRTYTATTSNGITLKSNEAWYIDADIAAVLEYLVQWALESGLLGGLVKEPTELVATIFENLENNPTDVIAALVELLNPQEYPAKNYEWFTGTESVVGNSAYEIYLNPGNDWTKEKAEYLYNNLDGILTAVLTMSGSDFDLAATIGGAVDGLLTDKTLTALANILAKLDLNALLNEGKTEEEIAKAMDVNALVKQFLGLDLAAIAAKYADIAAAVEADPKYVHDFGVDADTTTFAAALSAMLADLSVVLDFILADGNLTITIGDKTVNLLGANGYTNAIVPLLEALGCTVEANPADKLTATINALVARVDALTEGDIIKNIINLLPGVLYFITSGGLSTTVLNLLQPILVIVDTVRPVIDVMDIIEGLEIGDEGAKQTLVEFLGVEELDLEALDLAFIFDLLPALVPALAGLDISALENVIYDVCASLGTEYTSAAAVANTVNGKAKKGAFNADFDQADFLTVLLSFVLEWATIEDNAAALDEMIGTNGIIANIGAVFADVEITYGTPNWMYWFETEDEFNEYVDGNKELPNTLLALTYPNDWSEESAQYIADNLATLADMVIGLIEINGEKYESVSALLNNLIYGDLNITVKEADAEKGEEAIVINYLFSDETINALLGLLRGILGKVDEVLLSAGYILDVDLVGLKNYECTKDITTISEFFNELAYVLDTYAKGLVDLLFFGDDFRIAKKSDKTDTIVINGGLGYEKGLALVLEALGCDAPAAADATVYNVLGALAARVEGILAAPVDEVIDLLPNLVYFLNANGAGVAVDNILQPVYALLDKINGLGLLEKEIDLADMLGFDLKYLSLTDILALVKDKAGLDLSTVEGILADLCFGKIEKGTFTYKMVAERKDVITVILTTALVLISDDEFAAKLEELIGAETMAAIEKVLASAPVTYRLVEWYALDESDIDYDNATVGVIKHAITYPNNWTEESAKYLADNLKSIGDMIAGMIDSNYTTLGALVGDKVNIYTPDLLKSIQKALGDLIGGLDEELKDLVNIGLGAADALLGADVQGLLDYDVSGVNDKASFVAALTGMLMEVEGLVDWLLLGEDYEFFVDDKNTNGEYDDNEAIVTISGGHGYAEGLALVLEALGVENLPDVYEMEEIDTQAVVSAVLTATFNRVDAILANPVDEVFNILPNVIYFINSNGLTVAVENLLGAINALLIRLEGFNVKLDIASLVDFSEILNVETELALDNINMEAAIKLVADLTGLNLDRVADILNGFALGRVQAYESVSNEIAYKMYYHDEFAKYDMITVLVTVALITVADDANAAKLEEMLGEDIYDLIISLLNMEEAEVQEFDWQFTDKADTDYVFSALSSSEIFEEYQYGKLYTIEKAEYIADNFGDFINDILYLLGLEINGIPVNDLRQFLNDLLNGSLYNSSNVIAIRDALAGVLANLENLEVNGAKVGGIIVDVLRTSNIADIKAVANVPVPEFTEDRAQFVASLCAVLEPLYPILKYVLADEDFAFFVNAEKTDAITLKGAEGYAYGIIPVLEVLECKDIMAPAEYYDAVKADGSVLLTSILNPLLNRVDELLGEGADPAQEILDMLPNLIYFINSNGVDTVVRNTLNAVYTVLNAIEPIAKIDLYEIIGINLADINFEWLFNKLLEVIKNATGYDFSDLGANAIAELTVGKLVSYTSINGKVAYKMVYAEGESGDKAEMVTVIGRLILEFIFNENNQELVIGFMKDNLGMNETAEEVVRAILQSISDVVLETAAGQDAALSTIYYVFYGVDVGADYAADGLKNLNQEWTKILRDMKNSKDTGKAAAGTIITAILGWDIFEDIVDPDGGLAPNGLLRFFQKIIDWFKSVIAWFENLYK